MGDSTPTLQPPCSFSTQGPLPSPLRACEVPECSRGPFLLYRVPVIQLPRDPTMPTLGQSYFLETPKTLWAPVLAPCRIPLCNWGPSLPYGVPVPQHPKTP